jgi:autotransporter-associated beta strand protein
MNKILNLQVLFALLLVVAPLSASATVFFNDTFSNGSTINSATPVNPTTNSASYEEVSSQPFCPGTPTIAANDLQFGITNANGGNICEIQAIFATNAIALTEPGDYIQLTIIFTNTSGIYCSTAAGALTGVGFGLYNSGGSFPTAGGMNGTEGSGTAASGGVQDWVGYLAFVTDTTSSLHNELFSRPSNATFPNNDNQDLTTQGSGTKSYSNNGGTVIGTAATPLVPATTNVVYTNILTITLIGTGQLAITNNLYNSTGLVTSLGGTNSSAAFTTASFDGLAMGFYKKADPAGSPSNLVDIASITVSGSVTVISAPPTITLQPTNVLVPNGAAGAFIVNAQGFSTTYQWHRNGTNLDSGGNISVINSSDGTSSILAIAPASSADVMSSYYVTVSGAGGYSTNSATNSLSLTTATNLIWQGNGNVWDLNDQSTINNWYDTNGNPQVFNFGDAVTFNDTGAGGTVTLTGPYLSAASVTVDSESGYIYTFAGTGSFAGLGNLIYTGPGQLTLNNVNTYSGGTIISNATAKLVLQNLGGLGTGPITLAKAGGKMEVVPVGTATSGINGNINVADNFTIQFDATGTFAGVLFGDLSGTVSKTLSLVPNVINTSTNERVRAFGTNTTYNANLYLDPLITFAPYATSGSQSYNGVISGGGSFEQKGNFTYLNGPNTYSGGTLLINGVGPLGLGGNSVGNPVTSGPIGTGPLFVTLDSTSTTTGTGEIFASGGSVTIGNLIQYPTGTNNLILEIGGTNALTLTGAITLNGNDLLTTNIYTARTFQVTNTGLTTISGVISDGGLNYGFNKTGSGVLALNNTETYTGPTLVSGGTLSVNGTLNAASTVTVTNGILGGSGIINGAVTIQNGGGIAPGNSIGTLTINNSLTIQGGSTNNFEVNKLASTKDLVIVNGNVTYNGTLFATNLAGTITTSDTFQIFNASGSKAGSFTNIIGSPGAGLAWTFNPPAGTLGVVQSVATNPTNIIFSVSGNTLNLSWPADHTGWILQVQTNSLATGLQTNSGAWFNVPGSAGVDSTNFTINPANGSVFYRLISP